MHTFPFVSCFVTGIASFVGGSDEGAAKRIRFISWNLIATR